MRDDYKVLEQDLFKCCVCSHELSLHAFCSSLLEEIINYIIKCTKILSFYVHIYIYYDIERLRFIKILNI